MAKNNKRGLPLKFTAKHLFPEEWPKVDKERQHKTPPRHCPQWKAIVDFRESESWNDGDLQIFADYFRVKHSSLSKKITETLIERNTDSSRKVLASIKERRKRNKPILKDSTEAKTPLHAGEPPNRIPIVQQGVLRLPRAQRPAHSRPRAVRSVTPRACAPQAGSYASALNTLAKSTGALTTMAEVLFTQPSGRGAHWPPARPALRCELRASVSNVTSSSWP